MYIPTVEPTATISQTTSIVTTIATSTSTVISAPSSDQPDIVNLCSGQIFCVIYLSAGPWDASNIIAFFKDFAQAIVLACVSIVLVLTILYFIIDKITGGEFFKEVAILHPDTHPRIVRADRIASTFPRAYRRGQRCPTERSLLVDLYDQHDSRMSRCYNTWPGSRCSQRTSLATLHTITEMDEEMEAFYRTSKFPSLGTRVLFLPSMPEVPIITLTPTQNQAYKAAHYNRRYLNPDWMSWEDKELHRLIKLWT